MAGEQTLPRTGDVLAGRYVLRERMGEGGMGIVFRAEQPALARSVAIKILNPQLASDEVFAQRFRDEARAASRVRHPGSVAILDCDVTPEGTPYIAMEHIAGRSLGRIIAEMELSLPRVLGIIDQILGTLAAVHACGVIHADVKSDNFLIDPRPEGDLVKMIDFGLAMIDGVWIDSGFVSGTPEYMAPEVIRGGKPTVASDLYGAGVILYEMLTGAAPFTGGSSQEVLQRQLEDEVIPPSLRQPDRDIPTALDEIVLRALDKDPRSRYPNAEDLARALRAIRVVYPAAPRIRCQACGARAEDEARYCRSCGGLVRSELARTSPDAPTRPCGTPVRRRYARGAGASPRERDEVRREIAAALISGDADAISNGYAELAQLLAREQRISAAIHELEEGLDVLTAGGPRTADAPEPVRRLAAALRALQRRAYRRAR